MSDAVPATTPQDYSVLPPRRPWSAPQVSELPKLTELTLLSPIGGGGGTGGSTVFGLLLAAGLLFGISACSDDPMRPSTTPNPAVATAQQLFCRADVRAGTVSCAGPEAAPGQGILGNQGINVGLRSTNVSYDGGTGILSADVTVENLTGGPIGTLDGSTKSSGVSVFFVAGPVASPTGAVTVDNPTGLGSFTGSGQPYFLYDALLTSGQVSSAINWHFLLAGGATSFTFSVLVAADEPAPGAVQSWLMVPGFGSISWQLMAGWGTDGLALLGSNGERATHENGAWQSTHDPVETFQFNRNAVWATAANDIAGFGYSFDLSDYVTRQWDGTGWRYIQSLPGGPSAGNASSILQAAGNRYVLGYGIWQFTGTGWVHDTVPTTTADLHTGFEANGGAVVFGSSTEGWLYKGGHYTKLGTGSTGQTSSGVSFALGADTTHVWAVSGSASDVEVRYYDGTGWTTQTLPLDYASNGVSPSGGVAVSDTSAFIIAYGAGTGYVFHWDGASWSTEHSVTGSYNAIWARNGNEIYFARNDGTVELRDNTGAYHDYLTSGASQVPAVAMYSDTGGFAFRNSGVMLHWNGTSLDSIGVGVSNPGAAWAANSQNAWVAHYSGSIGYWNGASLTSQSLGGPAAIGVGGSTANDVWAVGSTGGISHYDGTSWTQSASSGVVTTNLLWSVYAHDTAFAVAVGQGGTIVMWNGTTWSNASSANVSQLRGVFGTSRTNVWVVGDGGTIVHWDGSTWSWQTVGSNDLYGVWMRNANEGYAVGDYGTILRYDGTSWVAQGIGTYASGTLLKGISGHGGTVLVVGDRVLRGRR